MKRQLCSSFLFLLCSLAFGKDPFLTEANSEIDASFRKKFGVIDVYRVTKTQNEFWLLTEAGLLFNSNFRHGGKWEKKFVKKDFETLAQTKSKSGFRLKKFQASDEESFSLQLDNGPGQAYSFTSSNSGSTWKLASKPPAPKVQEEAVDLNELNKDDSKSVSESTASYSPHGGSGVAPMFKILFDLALHLRPGVSPWTFENYHALFLVDFIPKPDIQFSFEVNPSPKYYEFDYQVTPNLQVRAGRIWIPFDDMNPHNTYGGYMNNSKLYPPGSTPFLPDIWADLGVGVKYKILDQSDLNVTGHLYLVNGFGSAGADTIGGSQAYPQFATTQTIDNNTDKAIGGRIHALFQHTIGLGFSVYSGRYTDQAADSQRILMLGFDGQLRLRTRTTARIGYVYMSVGLLPPATESSFQRAGFYAELEQKFLKGWFAGVRGGLLNPDNRIADLSDQTVVGGRVGYEQDIWQLQLQYHKDLNDAVGKTGKEFTALHFMVKL